MDGISEISPGAVTVWIDGRAWRLAPLRLCDYAEMERQLLGDPQRPTDRVTRGELNAWLTTADGVRFEFWLRVRRDQPNVTWAAIQEMFADRTDEIAEMTALATRRTGEYPLGNSPSRCRSVTPAAASRFLGGECSAA